MPHAGPSHSMSPPPTAGPNRIARFRLLALSRIALWSCSAPTMSCRMSWSAAGPRRPVDEEDDDGVPDAKRVGEEEDAPRDRREHEQALAHLDEPPAVVAIGQRPRVDREEEEGHPVADDGKATERRRVKLLEDDPVTDDVLAVVGRGGQGGKEEEATIIGNVQRREARGGRTRGSGQGAVGVSTRRGPRPPSPYFVG